MPPTSAINVTLLAFAAECRAVAPPLVGTHRCRSISHPCTALSSKHAARRGIFRVVQVTKSLQDPLEVGNNLPEISDNVRE